MFNVGIVGQGFVGSAIREGLKNFHNVCTFDLNPEISSCDTLEECVKNSEIIFVCLPTPMRKDGSCDTRIVEKVLMKINSFDHDSPKIAIIKSTVPPGTTSKINKACKNIDVMFSPEFLTEANSFEDFKNQTRIILGGPRPATSIVKTMFRKAFPEIPIVKTSSNHAEMVKYFINCFLSTKVIFANQMFDLCEASGIDYDKVCEYALLDKRIGTSHLAVPGPDGDRGFGGHCFPKDLSAMIAHGKKEDTDVRFLQSVQRSNDEYRKDRDWEKMKGRAVSED